MRQRAISMRPLIRWSFAFAALVGATALPARADSPNNPAAFSLTLKEPSRIWITGDSTLHPFGSTATAVELNATFQNEGATAASMQTVASLDVANFEVSIPVEKMKSGERGLDKNMYKALKAEANPVIRFRLTDKRLGIDGSSAGPRSFTSAGDLTIAGKTNPIQLESTAEWAGDAVRITGSKHLKMSDYGVKPPTILGMIKVRDEVVVHYDLLLVQPTMPK